MAESRERVSHGATTYRCVASTADKTVLLLDMFGVIITEGHLVSNRLSKLFPDVSLTEQREAYYAYEKDEISRSEFWARIGGVGSVKEHERLFFSGLKIDEGFYEVVEFVASVLRLAVLSNMPSDWKEPILDMGIGPYLEECFVSGDERLAKPRPEFFRIACARLNVDPERVVFVDDNHENLAIAHELGMTTVWVDRANVGSATVGSEADYRVEHLGQMRPVLESILDTVRS